MAFEKNNFEQNGLKIDKDRVLTYSKLSCPLDCKYCFVDDMNYNQEKNVAYLSERQKNLIKNLPKEISLIMLGCDTEFFQSKKESLEILEELEKTGKNISVITKLHLPVDFLEKIRKIDEKLRSHNNFLTLSISLPCIDSAKEWEAKAPSPTKRIETLKNAFKLNIKTLVALRPLLPDISEQELKRIIELTKDYCFGYYSGPLYLKDLGLFGKNNVEGLRVEKIQPHWMPEGNYFYKIEKDGQMDILRRFLLEYDKPIFEGAADGIDYLKKI